MYFNHKVYTQNMFINQFCIEVSSFLQLCAEDSQSKVPVVLGFISVEMTLLEDSTESNSIHEVQNNLKFHSVWNETAYVKMLYSPSLCMFSTFTILSCMLWCLLMEKITFVQSHLFLGTISGFSSKANGSTWSPGFPQSLHLMLLQSGYLVMFWLSVPAGRLLLLCLLA